MSSHSELTEFELVWVIVNFGQGSKVMQTAKQHGMSGGTVLLGKGTIRNKILEFLAINDVSKEIVLMVGDSKTVTHALDQLDAKFKFAKPHHGIAFTTSVGRVLGASTVKNGIFQPGGGAKQSMYNAITIIVEKGNSEYVIDAATEAGAKGGTVINARGSGIHEVSKLLAMEIEPEKDMVLILAKKDATDAIVESIRSKLRIDEPGNGIIFIQDVNRTYGLHE